MPAHVKVAVNLSPLQFLRGDIVETVRDALAQSGLAGSRLEVEITESVILADGDRTLEVMDALHDLGVSIALDDFGTGFCSLSHLSRYHFDKLKLDRCLIGGIDRERGFEMVHTIASLGRAFGITVVAEGIETQEQARNVRLAGCAQGQGDLFARPMSATDIANYCRWKNGGLILKTG